MSVRNIHFKSYLAMSIKEIFIDKSKSHLNFSFSYTCKMLGLNRSRIYTHSTCTDITFVPGVSECLSLTVVLSSDGTAQGTHPTAVTRWLDWVVTVQSGAIHGHTGHITTL